MGKMAKKKISEKTWYFYFGFAAVFIIIGFFWIFSHYAKMPEYIVMSATNSIFDEPIPEPKFPYVAVYMMVFGTTMFLIAKYYYEKNRGVKHVKRTRKHG